MSDVEWTNDLVIHLIQEYRKKAMLWDVNHDLYRAQTAKYDAYSELAAKFGCDVVELRKKLNSVFASYRREKVKIRSGGKSFWFLYPYLSFLPNHLEMPGRKIVIKSAKRAESPTYEEEHLTEDFESDFQSELHEEVIIKEEVVPVEHTKPRARRQTNPRPRLVRRAVARDVTTSQLDSRLVEAVKLLRRSELSRKKDECDSFGEYIAVSLRKHDERTQSMIKQAINNILFEQEMKKYNSNQYVIIPGMDENPLTLSDTDNADK